MLDLGLNKKIALVTGGNNPHGIGAAIARALTSHGASVFIHYFRHRGDIPFDNDNQENQSSPGLPFFMKQQEKTADMVGGLHQRFPAPLSHVVRRFLPGWDCWRGQSI